MSGWYVYLVECRDGTLYTGVATDVDRRIAEHNDGKGAKYTRGRAPVVLLGVLGPMERGDALRKEIALKRLPRDEKRSAVSASSV